ncbi:hypothetical protein LIER_37667 [Lithospermum erythrorhizon]|uniref:Reverse transcriptase zinc-binding domain-containing protein n=1 Tax=Lithospermum erythrorhizon TaxID=34254 RepID=A0AAV3PQ07_LITER
MSFLAWRVLHNWVPVDEMMIKKGISMASKCVCCCQTETLEHVFFSNPIADQLWAYFAGLVFWEARNKAKQAAEPYYFQRICSRVSNLLITISKATMTKAEYWTGESFLASQLRLG